MKNILFLWIYIFLNLTKDCFCYATIKLIDSQHNLRKPVIFHPLHSERKPVVTDSQHNQRKPVISDGSHDLRWPVLEEDSHDQRLPVVNWFHQSLSHLLQVSTVKQEISKIQQTTSQDSYPKTNLPKMKESNSSADFSSIVRSSISPPILESRPTTPAKELSPICGRSLDIGTNRRFKRVVGGRKSEFQRWPWMISLRRLEGKSFKHKCGAVLLNRLWAVTAAHCVDGKAASEIAMSIGPVEERAVQEVVVHPAYDAVSFESDLALLRLAAPSDAVPVCLPTHQLPDITGRWAVVTGWGRLEQDGELPKSLHEVLLPILSNNECERMFAEDGYMDTIRDIFVCAGVSSGGIDACEGDSGGPMVVQGDQGEWILVGLTSWGKGCAAPKKPGVYTRMSLFTDWISSVLNESLNKFED